MQEEKGLPWCWKHSLVSGAGQPRVPTWTVASQGGGRSLPGDRCDSGAAPASLGWASSPWVLQALSPSTRTCSADSSRNPCKSGIISPGASSGVLGTVPFFRKCGYAAMHWTSNSCFPCVAGVLFAVN